jgi:carboxyl-terminal processing protease
LSKTTRARRTAALLSSAAVGFLATIGAMQFAQGADTDDELNRFAKALAVVRAQYVDVPKDSDLVSGAINGMLTHLDAHSDYFDPQTFSDMMTKTNGSYGGVGLVVTADKLGAKVVQPMKGAPAIKAGIKTDDIIIAIDDKSVAGLSLDDIQKKLRGPQGSSVKLTLSRAGEKTPLERKLIRADVAVEAVSSRREGNVGYIQIPAFNDKTEAGLKAAVAKLKKEIGPGIKGYIIDLRDDGGGVLDAAVGVSDAFLDGGEIVSTRGRDSDDTERYEAKPGDIAEGKPIIILTDNGTASASEIVAGALQDHHRARIVGMRSFGKGSVQTVIPLDNGAGGALHMTTGRYYTPSGRSIQALGITPDVAVAQSATDDVHELREVSLLHHLSPESDVPPKPTMLPIRPPAGQTIKDFQLTYAKGMLEGPAATPAKTPHKGKTRG